MYIGMLNKRLENSSVSVKVAATNEILSNTDGANPIKGEPLTFPWNRFFEGSIDISVDLGDEYLVHEIELSLGNECWPDYIRVWNEDKTLLYSSHTAETGKKIRGESVSFSIEASLQKIVIELYLEFHNINVKNIDIFGAEQGEMSLFPEPEECTLFDGELSAKSVTTFTAKDDISRKAAKILIEKWQEKQGIALVESDNGSVVLSIDSSIPENGYRLNASEGGISIFASDLRGMVYGAEVLLKLENSDSIPFVQITDTPFMGFRGAHIALPAPDKFDFAKRLVKYLISPMGYNHLIVEVAGVMQFDSHPEINKAVEHTVAMTKEGKWPPFPHDFVGEGKTVSKALVRDFVEYCRSYGIEVIPEIQSLGHIQFMTIAHPDIAELAEKKTEQEKLDARTADELTPDFYPHSYCPSNPKSYEILFDLADEIIDVFRPKKYVHMGHDEVYQIGICPICKDKAPADLYADDVNRIHDYLAKKGLTMMIWSDMLQPVTNYKTPEAIHKIPNDIVFLDFIWYFHPEKDIEDNLLKKDNSLIYGNMYSSHFPRYEDRIRKQKIMGAEVSTWVATSEEPLGREGKLYDFIYSAQMMWSGKYTHHARFSYDAKISKELPKIREGLKGIPSPYLAKDSEKTVLINNGDYVHGKSVCGGDFKLDTVADSLIFEHTATEKITRIPWIEADEIGHYEVTYEDGAITKIPVKYAQNISHWNRRQNEPFTHMYYRHNGYTATYFTDGIEARLPDGKWSTLYRYEWLNPTPEKIIKNIRYVSEHKFATDVFVSRILSVKTK